MKENDMNINKPELSTELSVQVDTIVSKRCNQCQIEKPFSEFNNHKNGKYGKNSICKICQHDNQKVWRENNPNYRHKYYLENIERHRETCKKYAEINIDKLREIRRNWAKKNRDKRHEYSKKHYWNKAKGSEKNKNKYCRYNNKCIKELRNPYIIRQIVRNTNLKTEDIPIELIELKKAQLTLYRALYKKQNKES